MLTLHRLLASRCVQDLHLTAFVFDALGLKVTRREAVGLIEQLALVHEYRCPVPVSVKTDDA